MAGIEVIGRDKYGCFPLRGKFLNVREAISKQIGENPEIQNLCKIIGLQIGKKYEDVSSLRYGSVMIMTDQDHDGSHIKGLIINFIHHFWPSLLQINGFLKVFVKPIIKVSKGLQPLKTFFTIPEYE
jgi:DNA topoisomerase-2